MKTKRILAIIVALLIAATTVVSASAERLKLTDDDPGNQTEVIAHIDGDNPPTGDVTYIITIPDVVDFGALSVPASSTPSVYKDAEYFVEATKVEGLDETTQQISVYVKDEHASVNGDDGTYGQKFWISNKDDSSKKFEYDVYNVPLSELELTTEKVNGNTMSSVSGYHLTEFTAAGQRMDGFLRLDETQLCAYNFADIVGEYSGYMLFYSAIENI